MGSAEFVMDPVTQIGTGPTTTTTTTTGTTTTAADRAVDQISGAFKGPSPGLHTSLALAAAAAGAWATTTLALVP